jgi:hypothetical protein
MIGLITFIFIMVSIYIYVHIILHDVVGIEYKLCYWYNDCDCWYNDRVFILQFLHTVALPMDPCVTGRSMPPTPVFRIRLTNGRWTQRVVRRQATSDPRRISRDTVSQNTAVKAPLIIVDVIISSVIILKTVIC